MKHPFEQMADDARREARLFMICRVMQQDRNYSHFSLKHIAWASHGIGGTIAYLREHDPLRHKVVTSGFSNRF